MVSGLGLPDWRDERDYAGLAHAEPASFAWEWLRREPGYRSAAVVARGRPRTLVMAGEPQAAEWGLHAFEDPDLPAAEARPVWRGSWLPRVLDASAEPAGPPADRFDLGRLKALATLVTDTGAERLLLSDGSASVRVDIRAGTLLDGPVRLAYLLSGLVSVEGPLQTLRDLLGLWHSGRLQPPRARSRCRRLVLLLRARDAMLSGVSQRSLAEELLSRARLPPRWRSEAPSLRSQAQRLARGAQAMSAGGWRALLEL